MGKRKILVETDNSDWKAPKKRKPRKPMTEEQKKAAAERLEKAREKRKENNPDYGMSNIHYSLRDLPKEHSAHPDKVKQWIKTQKDLLKTEKQSVRQNVKGAIAKAANIEGYIRNMQKYLTHGDWVDCFYGEYQQNKVTRRCVAMAYDKDGNPKRDVGVWYPDIGVYTQEMFDEDKELKDEKNARKTKRPDNKRTVEKKKSSKKSKSRRTKTT